MLVNDFFFHFILIWYNLSKTLEEKFRLWYIDYKKMHQIFLKNLYGMIKNETFISPFALLSQWISSVWQKSELIGSEFIFVHSINSFSNKYIYFFSFIDYTSYYSKQTNNIWNQLYKWMLSSFGCFATIWYYWSKNFCIILK